MDTQDKLATPPPDLIPITVMAQQTAFLPDKPQPVSVCVTTGDLQVSTQMKRTGVRDRRCRVAWG